MIVFIDTTAATSYTGNTMREQGMGGSESSLIRVAEQLAKTHPVTVVLPNLSVVTETVNNVTYTSDYPSSAKHVISLRNPSILTALRKRYIQCKLFLWTTDLFDAAFASYRTTINETRTTVIAVSDYHKHQITQEFLKTWNMEPVKIEVIYNIVDLEPLDIPVNPNKLIFTSSSIKGLKSTLETFRKITDKSHLSSVELHIANPGYLPNFDVSSYKNVHMMGSLRPAELYKEVASSLCLFTANRTFPETFGLVFAEANALGTPFIAHPFGALRELYKGNFQLMDTYNIPMLIETIHSWQTNRPKVASHKQFLVAPVMKRWYDVLGVKL